MLEQITYKGIPYKRAYAPSSYALTYVALTSEVCSPQSHAPVAGY